MKFVSAVALAAVMLWVPVDGVAQLTTAQELPEIGEIVTYPDGTKYRFRGVTDNGLWRLSPLDLVNEIIGGRECVRSSRVTCTYRSR